MLVSLSQYLKGATHVCLFTVPNYMDKKLFINNSDQFLLQTNMHNLTEKWHWNWNDMCTTGLTPWIPNTNDLAPCFQQIFLQTPVSALFAISSAYYFGFYTTNVSRNKVQIRMIVLRIIAVLFMSIVPVCKMFYIISKMHINDIWPIDILTSIAEGIAYIVHFGIIYFKRIIFFFLKNNVCFRLFTGIIGSWSDKSAWTTSYWMLVDFIVSYIGNLGSD